MLNKHLTFFLASENDAKIVSVRNVCSSLFSDFTIIPKTVGSGISETPQNDEEAITGCHIRINNIESIVTNHPDYIIALEGLTETNSFGSFVYGWAVIKEIATSKFYYGCSGKVMLPVVVAEKLDKKVKLSDIVMSLNPEISKSDMDKMGTNGVLTKGLYTRVHEFETALKCAFGSLAVHEDFNHDQVSHV